MRLFIVKTDDFGYDEYDSFVISANDENEAIQIAIDRTCDKNWQVEDIGISTRYGTGIVHKSYNAG